MTEWRRNDGVAQEWRRISVILAKAGIHLLSVMLPGMDSCLRRNDGVAQE